MSGKKQWERFFDGHAPEYMGNVFTKNTLAEADFLIRELGLPKGSAILDVGCGTGRHSIELARRGYRMTGVDISSGMLTEAKKAAIQAGVEVEWIRADAARFGSEKQFDAALCLCEGAFGLLNADDDPLEHELSILKNVNRAIKPEAKVIFTVINGLASARRCSQQDVEKGKFDPTTMTQNYPMELETREGKKEIIVRERSFVPTELVLMFHQTGFEVDNIWGGTAGNWGHRTVDLDEMEIMIIARKKKSDSHKTV
jgi:2-polyprenyl-3-methyl-5-hydroxy-6-metoxy-1,4-benzoquinol methylase